MPSVTVTFPKNRLVYINGNYTPDFPQKIPYTFDVEAGENVFETLTKSDRVDYRATVISDDENSDCDVALKAVP